jgi:hypothetical protein
MQFKLFIFSILFALTPYLAWAQGLEWSVRPDFKSRKAALNISGAICADWDANQRQCYAVNDEANYFHLFTINGFTIVPQKRGRLIAKRDNDDNKELDLESVTYGNNFVYFVGSHGHPRRKGKFSDGSFRLFRLPVDKKGKATVEFEDKRPVDTIEASEKLGAVIDAVEGLSDFSKVKLKDNGANIEGVAVLGNDLFFGFRAPVIERGATVLRVSIDHLFGDESDNAQSYVLDLGSGYGIRDMAVFEDRILILAGGAQNDPLKPIIWSWKPGKRPRLLSVLDTPEGSKAETLMLVSIKKKKLRVLVMFDNLKNGMPTEFEIPRK